MICRRPCLFFSDYVNGFEKQLTALYKYASLWAIIVSIPKIKVIISNKRHTSECDNFCYGDNVIEKAEKCKYRGVVYGTKYSENVLKETFLHPASRFISLYNYVNHTRGARSARADARLCTSSGINLIVPLSFQHVNHVKGSKHLYDKRPSSMTSLI